MRPSTKTAREEIVSKVKQYIAENLDQELSISDLSDHACISYHHLRSVFFSYEMKSVHTYIKELRLSRAAQLLSGSDLKLTEVAIRCGFSNKSSLSKAFRKSFNSSPGHFRKSVRQSTQLLSVAA